ncbi:MAG: aminodeoxychorismate synthase component I [Thermoanaerobaculales bacterium]|nr:aminodeoxychorismate synthase component I [Thermoanaerobaculales bacterium]
MRRGWATDRGGPGPARAGGVGSALVRDPETGRWLAFADPVEIVSAATVDEVAPALDRVEGMVTGGGLTAVGFIAYEAAPAFDPALAAHPAGAVLPLVWFGLYDRAEAVAPPLPAGGGHRIGRWTSSVSEAGYRESVRRIRGHISAGDTYQVNHTFRLRASFEGDPRSLFAAMIGSQPESLGAFIEIGGSAVCSASPELFFSLDGDRLVSRPMKGTAARGWDLGSDRAARAWLQSSAKDRAENAMIVDMVRSDIGRVARVGSVAVTRRFEVERHPTVLQMTSTVEARTEAPVSAILAAMFPFASVTGAPKVRTMQLIRELEGGPRGLYTGAIGVLGPGRRARLAVAIRTAVVDRAAGTVEYGVGSGIVWDSVAADEHRECLLKGEVATRPQPGFELLETMLLEVDGSVRLLDRHLDRLAGAAEYFGRPFDRGRILEALRGLQGPLRIRLLLAADGSLRVERFEIETSTVSRTVRLGLAGEPVDDRDPFLHFKTTRRETYDRARSSRPGCDDVLLWNRRGEVTESTVANLVARIDGRLVTPPVSCGLLAGTLRGELLDRGEIAERLIRVDEIAAAERLFLVSSVRGWRSAEWVDGAPGARTAS